MNKKYQLMWGGKYNTVIPKMEKNGGPMSLGVEESVTISGSLDNLYRVSHGDMQINQVRNTNKASSEYK